MKASRLSKIIISVVVGTVFVGTTALSAQAAEVCTPYTATYVSSGASVTIDGGIAAAAAYTSPLWAPAFGGASWIWSTEYVSNPEDGEVQVFYSTFTLPGPVSSSTLLVAADDYFVVSVNGTQVASEFGEGNFLTENIKKYQTPSLFHAGTNSVVFEVTNAKYFYPGEGTPTNNPAGLLFVLSIEGASCVSTTVSSSTQGGGGNVVSGPLSPGYQQPAPTAAQDVSDTNNQGNVLGTGTAAVVDTAGNGSKTDTGALLSTTSVASSTNNASISTVVVKSSFMCALSSLFLVLVVFATWLVIRFFLGRHTTVAKSQVQKFEFPTLALASLITIFVLWFMANLCMLTFFVICMVICMLVRVWMFRGR